MHNNAKEMVVYKHHSPASGCWTFAICLPKPLVRKPMTWHTEVLRKNSEEQGLSRQPCLGSTPALSPASCMNLDKSFNYNGTNYIMWWF